MAFKNKLYPIHFYGRVRGKCDGRLQNWPGIANERPKFLAMHIESYVQYASNGTLLVFGIEKEVKKSSFVCI